MAKVKNQQCCLKRWKEKLTYFMYFPSPPLEAGLSISTFCFFLLICTRKLLFIYTLFMVR